MNVTGEHETVEDLLGAYALDAVEPAEREAVERHLRDCPRCRAEVAEHRETAALLANTGAPAPAGVWDRIAGSLEEAPPPMRAPGVVVPMRPSRRSIGVRAAAGAAAVAAAVAVLLGVAVVDQGRRIDDLRAASRQAEVAEEALRAFTDPTAEQLILESPDGAAATTVAVLPDGTGYLVHDNLPALPDDSTYQLWALVGEDQLSAAVLGADPGISEFTVDGPVDGFAVTRERAGGAEVPNLPPVAVGFGDDA
jgi:Anti-sigma-K factor rskA/Putative zinc-finger